MSPREKEFTERINVFFTPEQMQRIKAEAEKVEAMKKAEINDVNLSRSDF